MDLSFSNIAAGIVFGSFGIYLLKRAKKFARLLDVFFGIGLLILPYFIDNPWLNWSIGSTLLFLAYRYRR
jgi:hypothetical protein